MDRARPMTDRISDKGDTLVNQTKNNKTNLGMGAIQKKGTKRDQASIQLGARVRKLRVEQHLTLAQVSKTSGLAPSTISKIENSRLSPTFETLLDLARGLRVEIGRLFSDPNRQEPIGRRAITRHREGQEYNTHAYTWEMLCTEVSKKNLFPLVAQVKLRTLREFGPLISHEGEEVIYVLSGQIELHTDVYEPLVLGPGDCVFFDSRMKHACLTRGTEDAKVLWVCSRPSATLSPSAAR